MFFLRQNKGKHGRRRQESNWLRTMQFASAICERARRRCADAHARLHASPPPPLSFLPARHCRAFARRLMPHPPPAIPGVSAAPRTRYLWPYLLRSTRMTQRIRIRWQARNRKEAISSERRRVLDERMLRADAAREVTQAQVAARARAENQKVRRVAF